jgi:CRP/FNR family cyclic AMP-dependent transcriptional regulator
MNANAIAAMPVELAEVAEHPFLRGLSDSHLTTLASVAMRLHFAPGDVIFRQGDPANRFYLLIKGKISLSADHEESSVLVQTIGAGEVLGWSWLFPPYYTHYEARAIKPTEAMFFYATRLRELCDEDHDLGYELLRRVSQIVVERLHAAQLQLIHLHGHTAREFATAEKFNPEDL